MVQIINFLILYYTTIMSARTIISNDGSLRKFKMAASTTIVDATFLAYTGGFLTPATAATTELFAIARESKISGAGENPEVLVELLDDGVDIIVDTAGNTSQALVGTKIDLTNASTANQAASTTKVLLVTGVVGEPANKQVRARKVDKIA